MAVVIKFDTMYDKNVFLSIPDYPDQNFTNIFMHTNNNYDKLRKLNYSLNGSFNIAAY